MRWERVPILGNNPVFCFEARRLWRRRTVLVLVLVVVSIGLVSGALRHASRPTRVALELPGPIRVVWSFLGSTLLADPPDYETRLTARLFSDAGDRPWYEYVLYGMLLTLSWMVMVAAKYLVAPLAAASIAGDRAARRLGPLLVTWIGPESIVLGKLSALLLPFVVLVSAMAGGFAALSLPANVWLPKEELRVVGQSAVWLLFAAMAGLCAGAWVRQPAHAVAVSVLVSALALPCAAAGVEWLALLDITGDSSARDLWSSAFWPAALVFHSVCYGLGFVALWLSTRAALARATE